MKFLGLNNGSSVFFPLAVSHVHVLFNVTAALHSLIHTFMQADVFEELLTNSRLQQGYTSLTIAPLTIQLMGLAGNTPISYNIFILKK